MKKDKEWLKEEIKKDAKKYPHYHDERDDLIKMMASFHDVIALIDQLEEPEQEKVVIPQFVADFITEIKPNFNIRTVFTLKNNKHEQGQEWALDNPDVFARAWIDGYTVEKEPQYYVRENNYLLCKYNDEVIDYVEAVVRKVTDSVELKLTGQEIKDYDERYWAFREEITK